MRSGLEDWRKGVLPCGKASFPTRSGKDKRQAGRRPRDFRENCGTGFERVELGRRCASFRGKVRKRLTSRLMPLRGSISSLEEIDARGAFLS